MSSSGEFHDDGTPGFGALVALIALIAAALLATRRND
ncbi:PGF-CTERM sorting domain-containing protein [Halorubrum distributum]|nr:MULTISPECIES: PGF-CTERM sorting domain-containing protein [Halorubrum distributum group]